MLNLLTLQLQLIFPPSPSSFLPTSAFTSGANVLLTTGGIDDMCLKYFVDVGAMAVRRVLKKDLKRIAKATGGKVAADYSLCLLAFVLLVF